MQAIRLMLVAALLCALAPACGGGGGDADAASPTPKAKKSRFNAAGAYGSVKR